jgi:hypothetical protein
MRRVEIEYTNGMKGYLSVPTEEEIAAEKEWVNDQLDKLTSQFGSLLIEEQ